MKRRWDLVCPQEQQNKKLTIFVMLLAIFHYYTKFSGFVAYLFCAPKKNKMAALDFFFLCGVLSLGVFQLFMKDIISTLIDFRFYWGWIFFYFFFKTHRVDAKLVATLLVMLSIMVLIEAALINTVISPWALPNYPKFEDGLLSEYNLNTFYQRPYSFGASATVGSSLLVVLMDLCGAQGWRIVLASLAVVSFLSGTGLFALVLLFIVRYRNIKILSVSLTFVAICMVGYFLFPDVAAYLFGRIYSKVSVDYFSNAIFFKQAQIVDSYKDIDLYSIVFGDVNGFRGGDFGFLAFVLSNGVYGMFLFLFMLFVRLNRANKFSLFILVSTSFHYPVIFFLPGQMIFGLLLSMSEKNVPCVSVDYCNQLSLSS